MSKQWKFGITFCVVVWYGCDLPPAMIESDIIQAQSYIAKIEGGYLTPDLMDSIVYSLRGFGHLGIQAQIIDSVNNSSGTSWRYCVVSNNIQYINPSIVELALRKKSHNQEASYFGAVSEYVRWFRCESPVPDSLRFSKLLKMHLAVDNIQSDSLRFLAVDLYSALDEAAMQLMLAAVRKSISRRDFYKEMQSGCRSQSGCPAMVKLLKNENSDCMSSRMLFCGNDSILKESQAECRCRRYF